jgi:hypothetical protein
MSTKKEAVTTAERESVASVSRPLFARGIETGQHFASAMSALMADLATGAVTPQQGNAICNAGGKLLKVVEMQFKYGTKDGEPRTQLKLT